MLLRKLFLFSFLSQQNFPFKCGKLEKLCLNVQLFRFFPLNFILEFNKFIFTPLFQFCSVCVKTFVVNFYFYSLLQTFSWKLLCNLFHGGMNWWMLIKVFCKYISILHLNNFLNVMSGILMLKVLSLNFIHILLRRRRIFIAIKYFVVYHLPTT